MAYSTWIKRHPCSDCLTKKHVHIWSVDYSLWFSTKALGIDWYLFEQVVPELASGKNIMIAAHGNSLRAIIMYLDKLTSQEVY